MSNILCRTEQTDSNADLIYIVDEKKVVMLYRLLFFWDVLQKKQKDIKDGIF